ncbi:HlyD family type I secretion periplasmic adaptor subunit [Roseibium porphyridii]|uniref:Membrane fusion protein (MFP) family protein n=1 Tax=Roseibium porphyridii TaxID=2866279 RepID=A0ABY8FAF4_9HYPH|nr:MULTISPECIES: HlyD family type I secretion periplasmic adaptor subunit [Stappiaceae]QFT31618.1 Hemolysin secretion protein D, chromosomal [Labrenzia sp. THAF82]WFE92196.1 HlyD family type I secretion periplasmic adaptor subunit [Roseibium sp. KMA01]
MASGDWNYANDIRDIIQTRPPRYTTNVIRIGLVLFVVALLWAYFASIEEVTRGDGRVIPSRQIQVVQAPDTGIVEKIFVREGDIVEQGQALIEIDDTTFSSQLGEIRQRRWALMARIARLDSEADQLPLEFPELLTKAVPELIEEEENVYRDKKISLDNELSVLRNQASQKEQEYQELLATETKLDSVIEILKREVEINQRLFERKVLPEIEFLRLQRQLKESEGELAVTKASVQRALAAKEEAKERSRNATSTFVSEARQQLAEARGELAVINESMKGAADRVRRTELVSPVKGIVNKLNITTIGAVVQPAADLVEIVPLEDTLLIEAQIRPKDVAFLHPGQKAQVKITAYDFSVYGGLEGFLERISADTTEDEEGNRFFRVMIRTDKNYLGSDTDPLPIIPGMVASIDILTGEKTVLDYILKPIKKVRDEALRER